LYSKSNLVGKSIFFNFLSLRFNFKLCAAKRSLRYQSHDPKAQVFESKKHCGLTIEEKQFNLNAKSRHLELKDGNNKPIWLCLDCTAYFKGESREKPTDNLLPIMVGAPGLFLLTGYIWESWGPKRIVVDDPNYNQPGPYELVN